MRKDSEKKSSRDNHPGRKATNSGSGGGGRSNLIASLLPLLLKKPKRLIVVGIIFGAWYFFGGSCNAGGIVSEDSSDGGGGITNKIIETLFSTGLEMSPEKYDATAIFEPLADNIKNPLPEQFSLLEYAPKRLNQGRQGSCVAWASSYAARTILEARKMGVNPNSVAFSPSYLYNQIALTNCQGSYLPDAMKAMAENGNMSFIQFEYDEQSCSNKPDAQEKRAGRKFAIHGFNRLSRGDNAKEIDMLAIKQHLAQGAPVVVGMIVGGTFMNEMRGSEAWSPSKSDYDASGFGGHAMCVIGYDDYKEGGSFQIMNSWGEDWGKQGVAWVRYKDFNFFVREAYGIDPMGNADAPEGTVLNAQIALKLNEGAYIPFKGGSPGMFSTSSPVRQGDLFKVEITNDIPCYIYVFGEDTDGTSYVLFPYTEKHSPYCGITGTRLFPKDYSMETDDIGNRDHIAIVMSSEPIDYNDFNNRISKANGAFGNKFQQVVGLSDARFSNGNPIELQVDLKTTPIAAVILSIDKQ
ncbi:MAG: hypothetical protein ACJAU0_000318 [Flavobacteriales bacterium]|jgi:hypothetical protein